METNPIDNIFRDTLTNYSEVAPPSAWTGLEQELGKTADKTAAKSGLKWVTTKWIAGTIGAAGLSIAAWYAYNTSNEPKAQHNAVETTKTATESLTAEAIPEVITSDNSLTTTLLDKATDRSVTSNTNEGNKTGPNPVSSVPTPFVSIPPEWPRNLALASEQVHKDFKDVPNNGAYSTTTGQPDDAGEMANNNGEGEGLENDLPNTNDNPFITKEEQNKIMVPNVFSPNNDGNNDSFYIEMNKPEMYELVIRKLNGQIVFTSKNVKQRWDGKCNGIEVPSGKYIVTLVYKMQAEKEKTKTEIIELIRKK